MDQCLFNQALLDIYGTNSSNSTATQKSSLLGFNSNNGGSGNGNGNAHHQIGLMNDGAALLENPYGALLGGLYDNDQSLKSYSFNLGDPIVANDKDLTNFGMFNMNSEADFINMANSEWDKNLVNIDKHQNNDDGSHIRNTNINGNSNGNSNANGNGNSKDEHNVIIDKLQEELQMLTRNCSGDNVVNTLAPAFTATAYSTPTSMDSAFNSYNNPSNTAMNPNYNTGEYTVGQSFNNTTTSPFESLNLSDIPSLSSSRTNSFASNTLISPLTSNNSNGILNSSTVSSNSNTGSLNNSVNPSNFPNPTKKMKKTLLPESKRLILPSTASISVTSSPTKTSSLDYNLNDLVKFQKIRRPSYSSDSSLSSMSDTNGQNNNSNFFNPSSNRRHSDSRLSLAELTSFLKLGDDLKETATREKNILTVLKDELGFELGLKTWIRDTSLAKRVQLIENLTEIVENRYHYGYDKKIIEVIVRRASYYTMQGRLRRERRIEQKGKMNLSLVNKVRKNKKIIVAE